MNGFMMFRQVDDCVPEEHELSAEEIVEIYKEFYEDKIKEENGIESLE